MRKFLYGVKRFAKAMIVMANAGLKLMDMFSNKAEYAR